MEILPFLKHHVLFFVIRSVIFFFSLYMKKIFFSVLSLMAFPAMTLALENEEVYCTMDYTPVCAELQIECVTTPCNPIQKTFGNECELGKDSNATKLYDGACKIEGGPAVPLNCTSWFDGCNTCGAENGELTACTMMACETPTEAECRAYEEAPKACTREYVPVCGQPPMPTCPEGALCKIVPPEPTTYGNKCVLESEGAEFLYEGECTEEGVETEGSEEESSEESESFPDVLSDTKFSSSISYIKEKGYVQGFGDGTFRPQHEISRYEFAKIIISARYTEEEVSACDVETDLTFSDVPKNEWFSPFVCLAQKEGIINGYADGNFGGINRVTTTEALKIILGAYGADLTSYETEGAWYEKYQKAGKELGLTKDISDAPDFFINRSEMAELVYQVEQK